MNYKYGLAEFFRSFRLIDKNAICVYELIVRWPYRAHEYDQVSR